jgi:hypothetical protein
MGVVADPGAPRVTFYTWNVHPNLIASVRQHGAHGYLSKKLPARELVAVPEAVHAGEVVISDVPPRGRSAAGPDRPGRAKVTTYHKIDAGSRTQAVLWGVKHGCIPRKNRIERWRGNSEVSTCRPTTRDRIYHPYRWSTGMPGRGAVSGARG